MHSGRSRGCSSPWTGTPCCLNCLCCLLCCLSHCALSNVLCSSIPPPIISLPIYSVFDQSHANHAGDDQAPACNAGVIKNPSLSILAHNRTSYLTRVLEGALRRLPGNAVVFRHVIDAIRLPVRMNATAAGKNVTAIAPVPWLRP